MTDTPTCLDPSALDPFCDPDARIALTPKGHALMDRVLVRGIMAGITTAELALAQSERAVACWRDAECDVCGVAAPDGGAP